jgi:hypothetical protein
MSRDKKIYDCGNCHHVFQNKGQNLDESEDNLSSIRISWKDGRSEVRKVKQSEVEKWKRKIGEYISKVEEL